MFTKVVLSTALLAGTALAQQCSGDITIKTSADAGALSSCTTYKGDVTIDSSASGQIALNGVRSINGDLKCNNATQLTEISADQLNSISGVFSLSGLTILSTLQFDSLSAVNQIEWVGLPALQGLNFNQGISKANQIYISNTQLNTLTGIELTAVGSMDVNNNPYLSTINVNDLQNVTESLSFSANGRDLQISFPNLEGAANLTFRNVSSVDMPSLSNVAGDMGFYSDLFTGFSAPNLTSTGGALAFVDSPNLNNLSFPMLTEIGGGFLIANNTNLKSISGFPKLQVIVGALDFAGSFGSVTLPSISDIRGGSNVQTTSTNSKICDNFNAAASRQVIKGVNTCITGKANPDTNPSATSGGSSSSSSKGAADSRLYDPSAPLTGFAALIAAVLFI